MHHLEKEEQEDKKKEEKETKKRRFNLCPKACYGKLRKCCGKIRRPLFRVVRGIVKLVLGIAVLVAFLNFFLWIPIKEFDLNYYVDIPTKEEGSEEIVMKKVLIREVRQACHSSSLAAIQQFQESLGEEEQENFDAISLYESQYAFCLRERGL